MADIEYTDRYGGAGPDPDTMCKGQCEGTGVYPHYDKDVNGRVNVEAQGVFKTCEDCGGTGKRMIP